MLRRYCIGLMTILLSFLVAAAPACIEGFSATLGEIRAATSTDPSREPPGGGGGGDSGDVASHGNFDQPDMFTGTASYRYELKLPPGTNGMEPKLALVYRSNGDNGWFGMGWDMEGLGFIERSGKKKVPNYDNTDKEFVLNMGGSTYELIPDDSNDNQYSNTGYYHTRCETWMKIHFDGSFWTVTDRNGVEYRFGYNGDGRVPIVDHPNLIRLWALDRVMDKHGNYISYSYHLDAANGEYYPDTITYTRNTSTTLGKIKTVTFVRETRTDNIRPAARWMTHRIKEILVDIDGVPAERYTFAYRYSNCSFRSLLASISRYGTGDVPETTAMAYAADSGSVTWRKEKAYKDFAGPFADVDGDGLTDSLVGYTITFDTYSFAVSGAAINNGDETFTIIKTGSSINIYPHHIHNLVKDIDADGRVDIVVISGRTFINSWPQPWVRDDAWKYPGNTGGQLTIIDLNDDCIEDIYSIYNCNPASNYIWLSKGGDKGWDRYTTYLLPVPFIFHECLSSCQNYPMPIIDVNGDGLVDLYSYKNAGLRLNSGDGRWLETTVWQPPSRIRTNNPPFLIDSAWHDYDGDGLSDYYFRSNRFFLNNGHGWTNRASWAGNCETEILLGWTSDLNGDGLADFRGRNNGWELRLPNGQIKTVSLKSDPNLVCLNDDPYPDVVSTTVSGSGPVSMVTRISYSNCKPDLLTQVKLPTGGTIGYEYKRAPMRPFQDGRQRGATWRQYVVSRITTDEGTGRPDAVCSSSFEYPPEGGRYDRKEKTALGFRWVKKTLPNGEYTITYFNQRLESAGRVDRVEFYSAAGELLREEINTWEVREIGGSRGYAIVLAAQETRIHGAQPSRGRTVYAYDACGNVVSETRLGEVDENGGDLSPADNVAFVREYINIMSGGSSNHLIGLLKREAAADAAGSVLADRLLWYDGLPHGQASKGLLTEEKSWLDNFNASPTYNDAAFLAANAGRPNQDPRDPHPLVTYTYDAFGNRIGTTRHNVRPDGTHEDQTETVEYDAEAHCLPVGKTNAAGHTTAYTWDHARGLPLTETDPNGAVKRYVYDGLGRTIEEYGPRDTVNPKVKLDYANALTGDPANQYIKVERQIDPGGASYLWSKQYLDGLGRVWKEEKQAPEGRTVITERQYEWHGLPGKEWLPYFSGSSKTEPPKISVYDAMKRPVSVTLPDGSITAYAYDGLMTAITDANGHVTRQIQDVHGRVVRVEQDNIDGTYVTIYEYDPLDRQTRLYDAKHNAGESTAETVMAYDSLGRLLSRTDPYNGIQNYKYDSLGNVVEKTDAKGTTLFYEYDELNRVVAKSAREAGAPAAVLFALFDYDESSGLHGIGRLTGTRLGNGAPDADYEYDAEGSVTEAVKHIGGAAYTTKTEYDALGRLKKLTYPDGKIVAYNYDAEALQGIYDDVQTEPVMNLFSPAMADVEGDIKMFGRRGQASIAQVTEEKYHGNCSLKVTCPVAGEQHGVYIASAASLTKGRTYTLKLRMKGKGIVDIGYVTPSQLPGVLCWFQKSTVALTGDWVEYALTFTASGMINAGTFYISSDFVILQNPDSTEAAVFYIDCLMVGEGTEFSWVPGGKCYYPPNYAIYGNWNAAGQPGAVAYANNTSTSYNYDPFTLRLTDLTTRDPNGLVIQDFDYTFDPVGNITAIYDNAPLAEAHPVSATQILGYDHLNRLIGSSAFGSYAYDKIGNITHKEGVDYFYEDPAHPYCPTRGSDGYRAAYDANGNLAEKWDARGNYWRYEYDAENMLRRVYKGPDKGSEILLEEYSYGADGIRTTKKTYSGGAAATTHYVYLGNNVIYEAKSGAPAKKLIWDNTRLVAEVTDDGATYNHPDHLGSTSLKTDAAGRVLSFVGTRPYGTFYNQGAGKAWDEEFADAGQVDAEHTTASVEAGKVVSGYTTIACAEILHADDTTKSTTSTSYVEVKNWSFILAANDYRRELTVEADIEGYEPLIIRSTGHIRVELAKPDGSRDLIFKGSKTGAGMQLFTGVISLGGLEPGEYRVVVSLAVSDTSRGLELLAIARNRIFRTTLTAKRVYQPSSILRTKAFDVDFDIDRISLRGATIDPAGTSVSWSFSTDGGTDWIPIELNAQQPVDLPQPARSVLLQAVLTGTETETPAVESYRLILSGSSNMVCEEGLRFTGKELDVSTGLEYFGARYYDPEVGRWTTVDPAGQGFNWYSYCGNNPLKYIDPDGRWFGFDDIITGPVDEAVTFAVLGALALLGVKPAQELLTKLGEAIGTALSKSNTSNTKENNNNKSKSNEKTNTNNGESDKISTQKPPLNGEPNSTTRQTGRDGQPLQDRHYDSQGRPDYDIDYTDHGNPSNHPVPHMHRWDNTTQPPTRGPVEPLPPSKTM